MMAEKARFSHDHSALELILGTSGTPIAQAHRTKRPGFDNANWERERENAIFAETCVKFSQNPGMKHHLLGTGNKLLAEATPFDQVWDIGLRADDADDPDVHDPHFWRGKTCSGRLFIPSATSFPTLGLGSAR